MLAGGWQMQERREGVREDWRDAEIEREAGR